MCEHSEKWVSLRNCLEFLNQTALEKNEWIPSQDPWGEGDEEKRKELFWKMRRKISLVSQSRLKTNQEPLLFFLEEILPVKRGKSKLFQSPKILSRFVGLMKEAHSISDPSLLPWAEFFHCLFEHRAVPLTPPEIDHIKRVFSHPDFSFIIDYLKRNHIDPCNSIIGTKVHSSMIPRDTEDRGLMEFPNVEEMQRFFLDGHLRHSKDWGSKSEFLHSRALDLAIRMKGHFPGSLVLFRVTHAKEMAHLAARRKRWKGIRLLMCDEDVYLFGRCISVQDQTKFLINVDPYQDPNYNEIATKEEVIFLSQDFLLPETFFSPLSLQRCIDDPLKILCSRLDEIAITKLFSFFARDDAPSDLLERAVEMFSSITQAQEEGYCSNIQLCIHLAPSIGKCSSKIAATCRILREVALKGSCEQDLDTEKYNELKRIESECIKAIWSWISTPSERMIFVDSRLISRLTQLTDNLLLWLIEKLKKVRVMFKVVLREADTRLAMVLNGEFKAQVNQWWATYIDSEVLEYLEFHGFDPTALPDDYTVQKPPRLNQCVKNLEIILDLLDPCSPSKETKEFLIALTDHVYVKVHDLMDEILEVLCIETELPRESSQLDLISQKIQQLDKDGFRHKYIPAVGLVHLVEDLRYLKEMEQMDEKEKENLILGEGMGMKKLVMTDVVPIIGLIISSFLRWKHDLLNVIEIWDPVTLEELKERIEKG